MSISLAIAGHGITLASHEFVKDDLAAGRLVQLFDFTVYAGIDYYLAYPEYRRGERKIRLFREWILREAGVTY